MSRRGKERTEVINRRLHAKVPAHYDVDFDHCENTNPPVSVNVSS